ncbi:NUDIX hydrolase [Aliikangiella sp. IMCC44359]|uniref:NUDIX hydrolase n=1 Tax=Aliikangiella sp. IMCC44359 TaxID=3459125 RepID=UPI00403B02C5
MDSIHVTVAAIIRRKDQYLLVKETASSGHLVYNQPAGHVELKESLIDAVIREVQEETGLDFTPTALIGVYLLSPATNGKTYLRFCFAGETPEHQQPSPQDEEILENCWLTAKQIAQLPREKLRSALVLKCIKDFQQGKRLPLESLYYSGDEVDLGETCFKYLRD